MLFRSETEIRLRKILYTQAVEQTLGSRSSTPGGSTETWRSEERRVGKSVDLGGRRIIKKKKNKKKEKKN